MMRVLIVDDHPIVVSGCRAIMSDDSEIELLEAADAESGERTFNGAPRREKSGAWREWTMRVPASSP